MAKPKAEPKAAPVENALREEHTAEPNLRELIAECRHNAAIVGETVNPTNPFALRYEAIAANAEALLDLIADRGHRGTN